MLEYRKAEVAHTQTLEDDQRFPIFPPHLVKAIRQAMPDASHHVYAYVIGHGATTTLGMSDDGEPSGTAGRPALAVLNGSGLGDVVVVTDLRSTNGTRVINPGQPTVLLAPGDSMALGVGAIIDLGDGNRLEVLG